MSTDPSPVAVLGPQISTTGACVACPRPGPGAQWCHCSGCHESFNTVGSFDDHRKDFGCLDPATVGLERKSSGRWGYTGSFERLVV